MVELGPRGEGLCCCGICKDQAKLDVCWVPSIRLLDETQKQGEGRGFSEGQNGDGFNNKAGGSWSIDWSVLPTVTIFD